ncbi:MAG TPA: glutamate--tRNA ligase family protein [Rhodopila sp.]|nr:glutamate--tRNA ligase family protein [Rhodopila sp.]
MTRVRFAPAPTGHVFVSGARVALANHLFARRRNGRMTLRLDDLDKDHARPSAVTEDQVMQDLRWLGIDWHDSFRQSERLDQYRDAIERLKREGFLYPCFESETELKAKQEFRRKRNQPLIYDRAMLRLTDKQRHDAEAGGKRPYWRFKLSGRTLSWQDQILGRREATLAAVSDPILVRADGTPAPVLASVLDDIACGTTHIIRGEDNAGNTAVQIELFEVLRGAANPIRFAHLPAIPDAEGAGHRRAGNRMLRDLRKDGIEPDALIAAMTGAPGTPDPDLIRRFDLAAFAGACFDVEQMLAVNRQILGALDFTAVADRLPGGATEAFWLAVRGSLDLLNEARGWWDVVAGTIVPPVIDNAHDLLLTALSLLPPEPWDNEVWSRWIDSLEDATHRTTEALLPPLRLALTGEDNGPCLSGLLPLIGRPRAASRLAIAAA